MNLTAEQLSDYRSKVFAPGAIEALQELSEEFYVKIDFENHKVTAVVPDVLIMMAMEIKRLRAQLEAIS